MTRILLVDDNVLFRAALTSFIPTHSGLEVVGEAGDGLEAIQKARSLKPDMVLMDIRMPRCDGLEATRRIKSEFPQVRIIMLTVSEEDEDLFQALKNGAQGYVLKNIKPQALFDLLESAARGEAALSPAMATKILEEFLHQAGGRTPPPDVAQELTRREQEVLQLVSQGATNKEIATALYVEVGTVKNHLHNILEKLHLRNRTEAAAYARGERLPRPPAHPHPKA